MTNLPEIAALVEEWSWSADRRYGPKCLEDIREDATFSQILQNCHLEAEGLWMAQTAFPHAFAAEGEVEAGVVGETIDEYDGEDPPSGKDIRDAVLSEEEMLERIPLPGVPENERGRMKAWLALPKKARVAIRRMHQEWGPHMHICRIVR